MSEKNEDPKTFEQAMQELDQLVTEVESGKISLEQTIEKYAQGMKLIQYCRTVLNQAEQKIEKIAKASQDDADSPPPPSP